MDSFGVTGTPTKKTPRENFLPSLNGVFNNVVGAKEDSARGHFRQAGLKIE